MRNHFSYHILKDLIHSRYYDLLIADSLRNIGISMVAMFVPLFLIKNGYSFFAVGVFYLFFYIFSIISHFFLLKVIFLIGIKRCLMISYLTQIIFYVILYNFEKYSQILGEFWYLSCLIVFLVITTVCYWTAHHIYFFVSSHSHNEGRKLGLLYAIPTIMGIFAPFLGGFLITLFSFRLAFAATILLLIAASFVLTLSRKIEAKISVKMDKVLDLNYDTKNWIYFIEGANYFTTEIIWPFFMFVSFINFLSIGVISIFMNFAYALSCFLSGKTADKIGVRKLGRWGAVGHSATLIGRAFSASVPTMSFTLFFGGYFAGMFIVALDSGFYKHSHENVGSAMMNRELYMHLGRIFMVALFLLLISIFPIVLILTSILILAGVMTFLLNFLIKKDQSIISN